MALLSVAQIPFLTTMGVAAAFAVAVAVLISMTLTPALLGFAGMRIVAKRYRPRVDEDESSPDDAAPESAAAPDTVSIDTAPIETVPDGAAPGRTLPGATPSRALHAASGPPGAASAPQDQPTVADPDPDPAPAQRGFFFGWVRGVTKWPIVTVVGIVVLLGLATVPAGQLRLALPDAGSLEPQDPARITYDLISQHFGPGYNGPLIVTGSIIQSTDPVGLMNDLGTEIAAGRVSLDAGASSLSSGMASLDQQTQSLQGQTAQLAQGAGAVADATGAASTSVNAATSSFADVVAELCQTPGPVCDRATTALGKLQSANSGTAQVADGVAQADSGAASLSTGSVSLAQGAAQVDSGAASLAQGLGQAVQKIPTYSDTDMSTLSTVASQPVSADQRSSGQGSQSVPLFCVIALWLGGLVIALARRAVPGKQLMTTVSSLSITSRSVGIGALLGAAQGVVIAPIVLFSLHVDPHEWLSFTGLSLLAGAVFAVVNQGLAAAFGVGGRILALFIPIVASGVGLASTVPPVFNSLAGFFPTSPALQMLRAAAVGDFTNGWLGAAACVLFGVVGFALVLAGVMARRTVRTRDLSPSHLVTG